MEPSSLKCSSPHASSDPWPLSSPAWRQIHFSSVGLRLPQVHQLPGMFNFVPLTGGGGSMHLLSVKLQILGRLLLRLEKQIHFSPR